jgi:GNAT superfamily N-acetyltransferase
MVMTSNTSSIPTKTFAVRQMARDDAPHVGEIWRRGLVQTAESYNFAVMKTILGYALDRYGQHAMTPEGDVGPGGRNLVHAWMNQNDRTMLVATDSSEGLIVGCIGVKVGKDMTKQETGSTVASVWRMSVEESFRRQGVGLSLIRAAEEWARQQGCSSVVLETTNKFAAQFYIKAGYREEPFPKEQSIIHHYMGLVKMYTKSLDVVNE